MNRLRTLYILIITQSLSLIGSRMSGIAIGIWLYKTKGSVTYLLLIPFFNEFPPIIFGNAAGLLVDRWKRKSAMIIGDLGQGLGTLMLLTVIITHRFELWHIYLLVSIQGSFSLLEGIAMDAATTMMVPDKHRERINAVKEMTFPLAGVIAPVLSGLLYPGIGMMGVLAADFFTFMVSVIVLLIIEIPDPPKNFAESFARDEGLFKETFSGFMYLFQYKELFLLSLYINFNNFMLNGPLDLIIPYIINITGSQLITSYMLGIMSLGALAGAGIIAVWGGSRPRIHTLIPGMILTGIMMVMFGMARMKVTLSISLFMLMIPLPISNALFKSIIQVKTPPKLQGRIFAAISQLSNAAVPLSFLLTGFLVDRVFEPTAKAHHLIILAGLFGNKAGSGMGLLIAAAGTCIAIASIGIYIWPEIRRLETRLPDFLIDKLRED